MYDTIIIGAGFSGLAAGLRLAHFGKKVCLLERHYTIGGLNSFYRLHGRDFDVGLHAVTNYAPRGTKKGPLATIFKRLQLDWDDFDLSPQRGSSIVFPGTTLRFNNDFALFQSEIARAFPRQTNQFQKLVDSLIEYEKITQAEYDLSARARLGEIISDPLLVEMLLCPLMWYGNARERDMDWGQFCILFRSCFLEGFARPFDGVRRLLKVLVKKFRASGGELRLRSGVRDIVHNSRRAVQVQLDSGETVEGRTILSSAGWHETLRLCGAPLAEAVGQPGRLSFVETHSVLDCQPREIGFDDTVVFFNDSQRFPWESPAELCDVRTGVICSPNNYLYTNPDSSPRELDEGVIRVTALANYAGWTGLPEEEYRAQKQHWFERINASAIRFIPDFRPRTTVTDMFTPRTIEQFTWHTHGAVYGAPQKHLDGRTPLENVFVCGTDQGLCGIVGAMISGITVSTRLLRD